jgi:hypothetical protein
MRTDYPIMFLTRVELLRASLQHRALLAKTNAVVGTTHRSFPFRASCRCWNIAASSIEMVSCLTASVANAASHHSFAFSVIEIVRIRSND